MLSEKRKTKMAMVGLNREIEGKLEKEALLSVLLFLLSLLCHFHSEI